MNKTSNIMIFTGTLESRQLVEALSEHMTNIYAGISDEYGQKIPPQGNVTIISQQMDEEKMIRWISRVGIELVVDGTHAYAIEARDSIRTACKKTNVEYLRLVQPLEEKKDSKYYNSIEDAVSFLQKKVGAVYATVSISEVNKLIQIENYERRLFLRLPADVDAFLACEKAGINQDRVTYKNGPVTAEMKELILREGKAEFFLTQQDSDSADLSDKMRAAEAAGSTVLVVGKPSQEQGYLIENLWELLVEKLKL